MEANIEKNNRDAKTRSIIAFCQASLISRMVTGAQKEYSVYDEFPFWTDEEKEEARIEGLKAKMFDIAKKQNKRLNGEA